MDGEGTEDREAQARLFARKALRGHILAQAGRIWAFEGRSDAKKHRTRDAVYKDLRRVATLYRVDGKKLVEHISPHSARKVYAVEAYQKTRSLRKVQELLNHEDEAVTLLYALADVLTARNHGVKMEQRA
jgi:integrase